MSILNAFTVAPFPPNRDGVDTPPTIRLEPQRSLHPILPTHRDVTAELHAEINQLRNDFSICCLTLNPLQGMIDHSPFFQMNTSANNLCHSTLVDPMDTLFHLDLESFIEDIAIVAFDGYMRYIYNGARNKSLFPFVTRYLHALKDQNLFIEHNIRPVPTTSRIRV